MDTIGQIVWCCCWVLFEIYTIRLFLKRFPRQKWKKNLFEMIDITPQQLPFKLNRNIRIRRIFRKRRWLAPLISAIGSTIVLDVIMQSLMILLVLLPFLIPIIYMFFTIYLVFKTLLEWCIRHDMLLAKSEEPSIRERLLLYLRRSPLVVPSLILGSSWFVSPNWFSITVGTGLLLYYGSGEMSVFKLRTLIPFSSIMIVDVVNVLYTQLIIKIAVELHSFMLPIFLLAPPYDFSQLQMQYQTGFGVGDSLVVLAFITFAENREFTKGGHISACLSVVCTIASVFVLRFPIPATVIIMPIMLTFVCVKYRREVKNTLQLWAKFIFALTVRRLAA